MKIFKYLLVGIFAVYVGWQVVLSSIAEKDCLKMVEASYAVTWDGEMYCKTMIDGTERAAPLKIIRQNYHRRPHTNGVNG